MWVKDRGPSCKVFPLCRHLQQPLKLLNCLKFKAIAFAGRSQVPVSRTTLLTNFIGPLMVWACTEMPMLSSQKELARNFIGPLMVWACTEMLMLSSQ